MKLNNPYFRKNFAFTLVELIVVIVILGILSTIGFVSYNGYLGGARDSNRVSTMKGITDSLNLYATKNDNPVPEDYTTVTASGTMIGYQGYVGASILEIINYTSGGKDPKNDTYYTYYLSSDRKNFQLLGYLEESDNLESYFPLTTQTHAAEDYTNRFPKVYGNKLGVLIQSTSNIPIQELNLPGSTLDIVTTINTYTAFFTDTENVTGSGAKLQTIIPNGNCKRIKELGKSKGSGIYTINPGGVGNIQVYCDMETDGGGWTGLTRINPSLKNSYQWHLTPGVMDSNDFYNYIHISNKFQVNEIYVSKSAGWDGSEYVFEKVGNDLYARRGVLKNVMIRQNWSGLKTTLNNDWIGFSYSRYDGSNPFIYNGVNYSYIGHSYVGYCSSCNGGLGSNRSDFPLYHSSVFGNTDNYALSNIGWGGSDYNGNVIATIFIR